MSRRTKLWLIWAGMFFALVLTSRSQAETSISVVWSVDCGKWVLSRSKHEVIIEAYFTGILNGLSMGSGREFWMAAGVAITPAQAYLWMDKHCRDKPLSDVLNGATKLFEERTGWHPSR